MARSCLGGLLMPSPPTRRLAFGLDFGPSGTYSCVLHLAPLPAEAFGWVFDARTFSLVFLSAGFGALCSGVSWCFLVFLRASASLLEYYRYISGSALWESPREREVCARTPRNVTTQVLPYGQSRVPRNLRQDASWEPLPLPLLLCPPSPVASKVIRPVGRCALPNFELSSPAPYCRCRCGKLTEPKTLGCSS